jgi:3D (Asp-Asp-Asp) domain-containing protein
MRPHVEHPALLPITAFLLAGLAPLAGGCLFDHGSEGQTELPASPAAILGNPDQPAAEPGSGSEPKLAEAAEELVEEVAEELGVELGSFELTYYWMTQTRDDEGEPDTVLYSKQCKELAKVTSQFARRLAMEGTGRLRDGRVINTAGACSCDGRCYYFPSKHKRWGVGVAKRALSPFRSVAVDPDHVAIGQMLYIPELEGLTMPGRKPWGGFVHDGCVVADDRGGNVRGQQLDFFTGRRSAYSALFRRHRINKVTVFDGKGRCSDEGGKVVASSSSPS